MELSREVEANNVAASLYIYLYQNTSLRTQYSECFAVVDFNEEP